MSIESLLSSDGSVLNLVLSGEIDIKRSLQIQDIISTYAESIVLIRMDLDNVTRIDTSFFSTLLLLYSEREDKASIELINCDKTLARRLALIGLDRLVNVRLSLKPEPSGQNDGSTDQPDVSDEQQ